MNKWVDVSTIIAATAGLWALAFAWLTYVMSVREHGQNESLALSSIVSGLHVELEMMRPWTGAGGAGYSKNMSPASAPPDWSDPTRQIWKFEYEAIKSLSSSAFLYRLGPIVVPFAQLSFSISRLFQVYDEYRSFVNSDPSLLALPPEQNLPLRQRVFMYNFLIHVQLIGGEDSDDPRCLYKAYGEAVSVLDKFKASLRSMASPWWFWFGHLISAACVLSGVLLLARAFWS